MNFNLKKIAGALILGGGLVPFFISLNNNNLNLSLVSITSVLIIWVIYSLLMEGFDIRIFALVMSLAGFLIALSVFFLFGIEEVSYPVGAVVFHSGGIAGALGIGFFSLFPILFLHHMSVDNEPEKISYKQNILEEDPESVIESDEWELATEKDLRSGEFEVE